MEAIIEIELGTDGTYDVHTDATQDYPIGLLGHGNSVQEALNDFYLCETEMKEYMASIGEGFPFTSYKVVYDVPSFLAFFAKKITLAGLQRITGVNQGQLSHYINGRRRPSAKTTQKIQEAVRAFGKILYDVNLA